jgi:hypothetical protein
MPPAEDAAAARARKAERLRRAMAEAFNGSLYEEKIVAGATEKQFNSESGDLTGDGGGGGLWSWLCAAVCCRRRPSAPRPHGD